MMANVRCASSLSVHSVIPPIITNETDRQFLVHLNSSIKHDMSQVDEADTKETYTVYKAAFSQIIEHVSAYKPLLTSIKAEYEDLIETIQTGQKEATYLSRKLKAMSSLPSTLRNYTKRQDELQRRIAVVKADNTRLTALLDEMATAKTQVETVIPPSVTAEEEEEVQEEEEEIPPSQLTTIPTSTHRIPGLTLEQSIDVKSLTHELSRLEKIEREINRTQRTRYSPKEQRDELKAELIGLMSDRDLVMENIAMISTMQMKLKIAAQAADEYMKIQLPHQTIGDAVVGALQGWSRNINLETGAVEPTASGSVISDEDDPTKEKEAELMLEYIEKFNQLLDDGHYEQAAVHAANSPRAILRTKEAMLRFKEIDDTTGLGQTACLAFATALMSNTHTYSTQLSKDMCVNCVMIALDENKLELVSHWISQNRLTLSEHIGNMLFARGCPLSLSLAQRVFIRVHNPVRACVCMLAVGRVRAAFEHAAQKKITKENYLQILAEVPMLSVAILEAFYHDEHAAFMLGDIVSLVMTRHDECNALLNFIQKLHKEDNGRGLRDAVMVDSQTSRQQWLYTAHQCSKFGYKQAALQLVAMAVVRDVISDAMKKLKEMNSRRITMIN